jgi:hypothetical protein
MPEFPQPMEKKKFHIHALKFIFGNKVDLKLETTIGSAVTPTTRSSLRTFRLIMSLGNDFFSSASIPTQASVYILEYWFLAICNAVIYIKVCSLLILIVETLCYYD